MPLIALCTAKIPPTTLSPILSRAYKASERIHSSPNLFLLTTKDEDESQRYLADSITIPPIEGYIESPFLGWTVTQLASFLDGYASNTVIDSSTFLVADEQTAADGDTLLLVHNHNPNAQAEQGLASVRLSAKYAHSKAVAVSVASKDVIELRNLGDGDGVFRGGSRASRGDGGEGVKGGKAPRKKLGV
ncbi:uncharacterized protein BDV14DRAFT_27740 [Aspergillus stella-maris]|uniref:uncharacterized protein n=1 Tax=Aspergillus stella-maris TaxID=1810926 RepID=UPI003CCCD4AE